MRGTCYGSLNQASVKHPLSSRFRRESQKSSGQNRASTSSCIALRARGDRDGGSCGRRAGSFAQQARCSSAAAGRSSNPTILLIAIVVGFVFLAAINSPAAYGDNEINALLARALLNKLDHRPTIATDGTVTSVRCSTATSAATATSGRESESVLRSQLKGARSRR